MVNSNTKFLKLTEAERDRLDKAIKALEKKGIDVGQALLKFDEDAALERLKKIANYVSRAIGEIEDITTKFMQTAHDNRMAMLDAELDAIQARYDVEGDILQASLDNNLITQETYEKKREALEKKRIDAENRIAEEQFTAQQKNDIEQAIVSGIANAAQAWIQEIGKEGLWGIPLGAIASATVLAKSAAEVSAIKSRQFYPVKYEDGGGVAVGAPHSQGGIPFTVKGSSIPREMEGGEYIIRKSRVTPDTLPILNSINGNDKYNSKYFATGGYVPKNANNGNTELLSKPIRAYITTRDLDNNEKRKIKTTNRTTLWK